MKEQTETRIDENEVERVVRQPAPLAPYWDGRTFDDALEISIHELHTEADRAVLYERLFLLLDHDDPKTQYQAISRLGDAFRDERREDEDEQPANWASLAYQTGNYSCCG